jgi:hypothetical protein
MFNLMRTHQRKLMLVVTVLTIISFVWFYSDHDPSRLQNDEALHIYDRNVSYSDFQRAARKLDLAIKLGLTDYAGALSGGDERNGAEFAVNAMIVAHEGRELGLVPDDAAVENAVKALPNFQTDGQFDYAKYDMVFQLAFAPQGFQKTEIDDIVRNSIIFDRIKKLLDTAPAVTPLDVEHVSRVFQPVSGVAILFDRENYLAKSAPTDAQIADFFKTNAAQFVTPEWRTVQFVRFPLPADLDKLEGKAKIDAQQKVATASDDFANKAAEIGFEKAAKEAGLKVETTLPFDATGAIKPTPGLDTATAASTTPVKDLAPFVFVLTEKEPVSRVIPSGTDFLVADLGEVTKSRAMTPDEARPQIVQGLTNMAAAAALEKDIQTTLASVRTALKDGKPFADAAKGLKTKPFINISLTDEKTPPEEGAYASSTLALEEKEVSGVRPGPSGAFAVWLEKRLPVDQKKFDERREQATTSIIEKRRQLLWLDWIGKAQQASGVKFSENGRG